MTQILKQDWLKKSYLILFASIVSVLLLVTVVYKNDRSIKSVDTSILSQNQELQKIKQFLFKKINSPYTNINYEIKKGDSIQKILKKLKIKNNEIQEVIKQYKKYATSNQLLTGNKIDIIVKKNKSKKDNSIIKFSIPVTKSTTIAINKNELGKITSEKIITKLYKRNVFVENIIKNNLYKAALEVKINPNAIIEFARIFGFEIDFQRDLRKNDYFKILYEKYYDEDG